MVTAKPFPPLKPCPFCGAAAEYEEIAARASGGVVWSVGCPTADDFEPGAGVCFGHQALDAKFPTKQEAADFWNRRAPVRVVCGENIALPAQVVGCAQEMDLADAFRCTDCEVYFHKACAQKHFGQLLTQADIDATCGTKPAES